MTQMRPTRRDRAGRVTHQTSQKGNPVDNQTVPEPVAKRADQLVVGDRIHESQLIYKFNKGPAEVVFLAEEPDDSHTFIAYRYPNRRYESMTVRSEAVLQVYSAPTAQPGEFHCPGRIASGPGSRPVCGFDDWDHDPHDYGFAADPTGLAYTRADDGEQPQPTAGRVPPHFESGRVMETLSDRPKVLFEHEERSDGLVGVDPPEGARTDMTGAAVTQNCVFVGDVGGWCSTHEAVHIAVSEGECGCPVYPYMGRGDTADTIIDHRRSCLASES